MTRGGHDPTHSRRRPLHRMRPVRGALPRRVRAGRRRRRARHRPGGVRGRRLLRGGGRGVPRGRHLARVAPTGGLLSASRHARRGGLRRLGVRFRVRPVASCGSRSRSYFSCFFAPKACLRSFSCSSVRLERTSVALVPFTAARNLSSVICPMSRNQPALPGGTASPISSSTCLSMPVLPSLPNSAPMPAPMARPRKGTKKSSPNSMPQKAPPRAPTPTRLEPCLTCGVLKLYDQVLLQLREREAEAVGLRLVLEAEYHQLAHLHSLSWW